MGAQHGARPRRRAIVWEQSPEQWVCSGGDRRGDRHGTASMAPRHHSAKLWVWAPGRRAPLPWTTHSVLPSYQKVPEDPTPSLTALTHLVVAGSVRDGAELLGDGVAHRVGLAVFDVDSTDEQVVGDVIQVPTELEPGAGGRDVVSGALPFDLGWVGERTGWGMALEWWTREEAL